MVAKFCSRSHGQPVPGVRSAAMIALRVTTWRGSRSAGLVMRLSPGCPGWRMRRSLETTGARTRFPPLDCHAKKDDRLRAARGGQTSELWLCQGRPCRSCGELHAQRRDIVDLPDCPVLLGSDPWPG